MRIRLSFLLSCLLPILGYSQTPDFQIYYENLSRPTGGAVNNNDILEIRGVVTVPRNLTISNVQFQGTIPTGTTYITGSLEAKTNEGVTNITNTGTYTDRTGDDRAHITGSSVVINLGTSAGIPPANGGSIIGGSTIPRFYSSVTIIQAAFKVRVTAANGARINITGNVFRYNSTTVNLNSISIELASNVGCGAYHPTNMLTNEAYGTFQTGTVQNRGSSLHVAGFTYTSIASGRPQDGEYTIVKNSSPTQYTGSTPGSSDRVHTVWDVFGDHSGSTNGAGNAPAPSGVTGGYMLLVNASYTPSTVFTSTITGLMPNSLYTLRFWIRNVCGRCAGDPTRDGPMVPAAPGVKPALAFSIDGYDYYTTGNINYTGQWVEKSFTFTTTSSTSININIRNNAPGGGGNDWAFDDLSINQCLVVLSATPRDFNAKFISDNSIQVKWTGGIEKDLAKYVVEYSDNGRDFSEVHELSPIHDDYKYQYVDDRNITDKGYYRLKLINKQGDISYSGTVIVRAQNPVSSFVVFPNPVAGTPKISVWSSERQQAQLAIFELSGKSLFQQSYAVIKGENTLSMQMKSDLKPGVYYARVTYANGSSVTQKFIVAVH